MIRMLAISAVLAMLFPALSSAAESGSAMARLAALTQTTKSENPMTQRPRGIRSACAGENVRCGNPGDESCCDGMFCDHPSGSTGICRFR